MQGNYRIIRDLPVLFFLCIICSGCSEFIHSVADSLDRSISEYLPSSNHYKSAEEIAEVSCSRLNVRSSPNNQAGTISIIKKRDLVELEDISPDGRWFYITTPSGKRGWSYSEFLSQRKGRSFQDVHIKSINLEHTQVARGGLVVVKIEFKVSRKYPDEKPQVSIWFFIYPPTGSDAIKLEDNAQFDNQGKWTYRKNIQISDEAPVGEWQIHLHLFNSYRMSLLKKNLYFNVVPGA